MGKKVLLPYDSNINKTYLENRNLPNNYTDDFTLMGFVVYRYLEALAFLTSAGYRLIEQEGGIDICIDTALRLPEIKALLTANNIRKIGGGK